MAWQLIDVGPTDWQKDNSGVYMIVHRRVVTETHKEYSGERISVRVDVMSSDDDEPIVSFQGQGNDVRKALMQWIWKHYPYTRLSMEHAAYIGAEIQRAMTETDYKQS